MPLDKYKKNYNPDNTTNRKTGLDKYLENYNNTKKQEEYNSNLAKAQQASNDIVSKLKELAQSNNDFYTNVVEPRYATTEQRQANLISQGTQNPKAVVNTLDGRLKQDIASKYADTNAYKNDTQAVLDTTKKVSANNTATANEINALLEKYKEYYNEDFVSTVKDSLANGTDSLASIEELADAQNKYWGQWKNESEYKNSTEYETRVLEESALNDVDFDKYSQLGLGYENPSYEIGKGRISVDDGRKHAEIKEATPINNIVTFNRQESGLKIMNVYDEMTEDEVAIYSYYLAKENEGLADKGTAQRYLDLLMPSLETRQGAELAESAEGDYLAERLLGIVAGLGQYVTGIEGAIDAIEGKDIGRVSSLQVANSMMNEDLANSGFKVFGKSSGQIANDLLTTIANQVPTYVLASFGAGKIGTALMGISAGGNAYNSLIEQGYTPNQARIYGLLTGISETTLQDLIGGLPGVKSVLSDKALGNFTSSISNAGLRAVATIGGQAVLEGNEEFMQDILDPIFKLAITNDWDGIDLEEALYSGMIGALSSGAASSVSAPVQFATNIINAENIVKEGNAQVYINYALENFDKNTAIYKLAQKASANPNVSNVANLISLLSTNVEASKLNEDEYIKGLIKSSADIAIKEELAKTGVDVNVVDALQKGNNVLDNTKVSQAFAPLYERAAKDFLLNNTYTPSAKGNLDNITDTFGKNSQIESIAKTQTETIADDNANVAYDNNGNAVTIAKATGYTNGGKELTFETSDGKKVSANNLEFADNNVGKIYTKLSADGVSLSGINEAVDIYRGMDTKPNIEEFVRDIDSVYLYGYLGNKYEKTDVPFKTLGEENKKRVYNEGRKQNLTEATTENSDRKGNDTKGKVKKGIVDTTSYVSKETMSKLSDVQKQTVEVAKLMSKALNINITFVESTKSDGVIQYSNEIKKLIGDKDANGAYLKNGRIIVDINAGINQEGIGAFTLGHELTHFIKAWDTAKFKVLADTLFESINIDPAVAKAQIERIAYKSHGKLSFADAYEEAVCNAMASVFTSESFAKAFAKDLAKKDRNVFDKFFTKLTDVWGKLKKAINDKELTSQMQERTWLKGQEELVDKLAKTMSKALIEASDAYNSDLVNALGNDIGVVQETADGEIANISNKDGSIIYNSVRTFNNGGKDLLEKTLLENGYTSEEISNTLGFMDNIVNLLTDFSKDYGILKDAIETDVTVDIKSGKVVLHTLTTNGDYPINFDLSTICKKRQAYQRVLNYLLKNDLFNDLKFESDAIAEVNSILRKYGFETACPACFVEARRMQIQKWAETIVKEWNEEVDKRVKNAKSFEFATGKVKLELEEINALDEELKGGAKNSKGNLNLGRGNIQTKMGRLLDQAPTLRRHLAVEDLLLPEGIKAIRTFDGNLLSLIKSRYGANSPKLTQLFEAYNGDAALMTFGYLKDINGEGVPGVSKYLREAQKVLKAKNQKMQAVQNLALKNYLYDIGGARSQSFSDFIIENVMDKMQLIADMAARRLPMHEYTKEISSARIFGMTGLKENMSIIHHIDASLGKEYAGLTRNAKGELVYVADDYENYIKSGKKSQIQSVGFKDSVALMLDPRYSSNVGTIAIGFSDAHIMKMLDDPLIRMVIPYHKSGLPPVFAELSNMKYANDYTDFQNTSPKEYYDMEGNLVPKSALAEDASDIKVGTSFSFNQVLRETGDVQQTIQRYFEYCEQKHPAYITIDKKKIQVGYVTLKPKFSGGTVGDVTYADFTKHPNYYKLIEDFNLYDVRTKELAMQKEVEMLFPSKDNALSGTELDNYRKALKDTGIFTDAEIEKYVGVSQMSVEEIIAKELGNRKAFNDAQEPEFEKAMGEIVDTLQSNYSKKSARDSEGNQLSQEQIDYFKDSKVRDENGNLLKVYHGTDSEFFTYDISKAGKNGRANGFGFYFTPDKSFAEHYGDRVIEAYLDIKKPISNEKKTITLAETKKLINDIIDNDLKKYKSDGLVWQDSFISNYVYTYDMSRNEAVSNVAKTIYNSNSNDVNVIYEIATANGQNSSVEGAKAFYEVLTKSIGFDGGWYGKEIVIFNSNQAKLVDNKTPTDNDDIRYSTRSQALSDTDVLELAVDNLDTSKYTQAEKNALAIFKKKLDALYNLQTERTELGKEWYEYQFGENRDKNKAIETLNKMHILDSKITKVEAEMLSIKDKSILKNVLKRARKEVESSAGERYAELYSKSKERQEDNALKNKYKERIANDVETLSKYIERPDFKKGKYVADAVSSSVIEFLKSIDFTSKRKLAGGEATKNDIKFVESLAKLEMSLRNNPDSKELDSGFFYLSPEFMEMLNATVETINATYKKGNYTINEMSTQELKNLSIMVKQLKTYIKNMNEFHSKAIAQSVQEVAQDTIDTVGELAMAQNVGEIQNYAYWKMMRPAYIFDRFGEGGKLVFKMLQEGDAKIAERAKEIIDFSNKTYSEEDIKKWEKQKISVPGTYIKDVPLPYALGLYFTSQDADGQRHLENGGARFAIRQEGNKIIQSDTVGVSEKVIDALRETLKAEAPKAFEAAKQMQSYMASTGAKWLNEISQARYGVDIAKNPYYYPISSDGRQFDIKAEKFANEASMYALLNSSFQKQRIEKANNAVVIYDFFDVFANHMASVAQYNSYALPLLDAMKWLNFKGVYGSVQDTLTKAYGAPVEKNGTSEGYAITAVKNILKAYNGTESHSSGVDALSKQILQRSNLALVAFKLTVALKQPLSYMRAAQVIDYNSLLHGLELNPKALKGEINEMLEHNGMALWKNLGYFDVNISRGLTQQIKHDDTIVDKLGEIGMKLPELADTITWGAMWKACKYEVKKENPNLAVGSDAFFAKVNEKFNDLVYKTQVVDSVMTKNEFMRDKSFASKMFSSFMGEPMTAISPVADAIFKYQLELKNGKTPKEAFKKHQKLIGRTMLVYTVSAVGQAIVETAITAGKGLDDEEDKTKVEQITTEFINNLIDELVPFNKYPIIADLYEVFKLALNKAGVDTYGYEPSTVFTDLSDSILKIVDTIAQKIENPYKQTGYTWASLVKECVDLLSSLSGIAVGSMYSEVKNLWNATIGRTGEYEILDNYKTSREIVSKYRTLLKKDKAKAKSYYNELIELKKKELQKNRTNDGLKEYDADELQSKAESSIKSSITSALKSDYIKAYKDKDEETMKNIRLEMQASGLYGNANSILNTCKGWIEDYKK